MMFPNKLARGDEVRVIAPSTSLHVIIDTVRKPALNRLNSLGFKVTYGRRSEEYDEFQSSSIEARVSDIHDAFANPEVKAILTSLGGYNCNQLLTYLDYDLIRAHPKIFCGYSDITALANAFHARTGLVTYSGPHFSTFGMEIGLEYTLEYFAKCLLDERPFTIHPSDEWSDDKWYRDQQERKFIHNKGYLVIHAGEAEGKLLGGNLCTLNLLQGTEFMPSLKDTILLLEDDYESKALTFDRDLQSLLHQPGFSGVRGIVFGRFQNESAVSDEQLISMVSSKKELAHIPVIANADFGHTTPQFTFPIGGNGRLTAAEGKATLEILEH